MHSGVRKFNASKFILDQYHQLEAIKPIQAKLDGGSVPTAGAARGG